jgi:hypothetical protein
MNTATTEATELAFHVTIENTRSFGDPYLKVYARLGRVEGTSGFRNLSEYDAWKDANARLAELEIDCQLDATAGRRGDAPYGYAVQFAPGRVRAEQAKHMAAAFVRIERGLKRLEERFGAPKDFVDYVARVADVLGVKRFCESVSRDSHFYTETGMRWYAVDTFRYRVEDAAAKFRESVGYVRPE